MNSSSSSSITFSKTDSNLITTLLIVLQAEFTRTHGEAINIMKVMTNDTFKKMAEDHRYVSTKAEDRIYIKKFLKDLISGEERLKKMYEVYEVQIEKEKKKDEEPVFKIRRKNQYGDIKSDVQLKQLINQHPGGLEVNDELLKFTYKKINDDLKRLYEENTYRKLMMKDKNTTNYLIFPKKEENELQIYQNEHKEFDFRRYLELCSTINAKEPQKEVADNARKTGQRKSQPDPNYQLQGYLQLKDAWLRRSHKK